MAVQTDQNATVYEGQDILIDFERIPGNVTLWTFEYTVRRRGAPTALITKTTMHEVAFDTATETSTVTVALTEDDLTGIDTITYDHGLWRVNAGDKYPLALGQLTVESTSHLP